MKTESVKTEPIKIENKEAAKYLKTIKREMHLSPQFLSDIQSEVLEYIKQNPDCTCSDLEESFGKPPKKERAAAHSKQQSIMLMMIICLLVGVICAMACRIDSLKKENVEILRQAIIYKAGADK